MEEQFPTPIGENHASTQKILFSRGSAERGGWSMGRRACATRLLGGKMEAAGAGTAEASEEMIGGRDVLGDLRF